MKTPSETTSDLRSDVRRAYADVAHSPDPKSGQKREAVAVALGYSSEDIASHGEGNLGLGCGNPVAHALLSPGDRVLDLGSGAGFDALIARSIVGDAGHVIGIDMTREMLARARDNASAQGVSANVEFREGTIESLPVETGTIDIAISNCVVNLSPDKPRVFQEVYRVLKNGGRLAFSDILLSAPLPARVRESLPAWIGCIAGASLVSEYVDALESAGFQSIEIERLGDASAFSLYDDPIARSLRESISTEMLEKAIGSVASYSIRARKG